MKDVLYIFTSSWHSSGDGVLLGVTSHFGGKEMRGSIFNDEAWAPLSYPDLFQILHPSEWFISKDPGWHGGRRGYQSSAQT